MKKCLILDYGVGNIASIRTFLRENNYVVTFGTSIDDIRTTDLLVLPGVGSFETAAKNLSDVAEEIRSRHLSQRPILAICLGFQLLTKTSAEEPSSRGLGILRGTTARLEEFSRIGWGKLDSLSIKNFSLDHYFFFNHSFGVYDVQNARVSARSGISGYCALIIENKTVGVQFHPERSQESGKQFLIWLEKEIWNLHD
jgi:imidazole glycerol-phosphate synthase subunit HisH